MLNDLKNKFRGLLKGEQIVTRENDPNFNINFGVLPNPDPILAKMGKDQDVYKEMMYDPHIMGELRSLRSGILGYERQFVPGMDNPESMKAFEFINEKMLKRPAPDLRWDDFIWNIYCASFYGQSIFELAWYKTPDGYLLPELILDRPARRFRYSMKNELRYLTTNSPLFGEEAPTDKRFLITRYMPSHDNPYGVAVMSSCFWSYTFKHAGIKWFAKFAEKYGIPWAVGRYPAGSDTKVQNELAQQLQSMVEDAVAAIPEGSGVELLERKFSGDPVQERLISLCNREMSKALTSQTLATEIEGNGSRAASETHQGKTDAISKDMRMMVSSTIDELLEWIIELNFKNATAPGHEFFQEGEARKDWAETIDIARKFVPISAAFAYERLQITPPAKGDELISAEESDDKPAVAFARKPHDELLTGMNIDGLLKPVKELLAKLEAEDGTLDDFHDGLFELFPDLDDAELADYMTLVMTGDYLKGVAVETR